MHSKISVCGGWADRQKGIVSAYVLSVLMDRDFKLDMPRPCDIAVFLAPNQVAKSQIALHLKLLIAVSHVQAVCCFTLFMHCLRACVDVSASQSVN